MKIGIVLVLLMLVGCTTASDQAGEHSKARASAKVHTELAGMYYERTQLLIALGEIELALQTDPNYAPAYSMRGLIRMALREYQDADADFQRSLHLDKNDSETQNNYGWFLCQRGKEKESIAYFLAALSNPLYGTPERAFMNAGLCSKKAGNNQGAVEYLQHALQLQADLPQALLAMAELSFMDGEYVTAKQYWNKFSEKSDALTAEQLWLAVRIERKSGDHNAESSYGMQLRKRFPDARETKLLLYGE